ncbi:MAG TPA: hypothetical protein VMF05_08955 [Stellaceae bacterium]|nr:hypothetical protein [Stellaceae bacterium]
MVEVQKIACTNNAGFVMWFQAVTTGGTSNGTDTYPIDQTRVIDLGSTPFREGVEFWPEVHAILGKTQSADQHIVFKMNGQTATYEVRGTTLNYSINLIGG